MSVLTLWMMLLLTPSFDLADSSQAKWHHRDYQKTTHKNFRSNLLFSQTIDFANIDYPRLHAAIFFATNETRDKNKRRPLKFALELERAAYLHAKSMVEQNFFSHQNHHDKKRKTPEQRAKLAGIENPFVAENIATYYAIKYKANTPVHVVDEAQGKFSHPGGGIILNHTYLSFAEGLVKQWMESSGHRENVLSKDAVQLGCGAYFYRDPEFHNMPNFKAVQNFQLFREIIPGKVTDRWP